jgi:hypothetical protein
MSAGSLARRFANASGVSYRRISKAVLVTLLFFLLTAAANAYTLVLRSGRQVNVPDDFKVTPAAVIYETSPGFSVTVWLSNVDFAATERANAEPAGSFAGRIRRETEDTVASTAPLTVKAERGAAQRVLTNRELEPLRLRREAQESEYERTRRERGMPSKEELQQRFDAQDRRLHELTLQMQAEREESELEALKSELVNVRRNLNELSLNLSQQTGAYAPAYVSPDYYPYYYAPPVQFVTPFPFGRRGFGRGNFGPHTHGRAWPYNPWQGLPFPTLGGPNVNGGAPLVMAPAMPMPRR